ncbi:glutathione-regulated potassium-efflux system protein KefB [Vibrio astriarenae]|nr:glutathione-regulated potassium-efflux system protein KefB [Vibrio sp. C7]
MSQVGEFAFVLLGVATSIGLISTQQGAVGIVVVSVSMVLTPWLYGIGDRLEKRLIYKHAPEISLATENKAPLVIVGLDEVGRLIAILAKRAQIPYIGVDINYDSIKKAKELGLNAHFGDIMFPSIRRKVGLSEANAAFVSLTHSESLRKVCLMMNQYPQLDVYARTNSRADEFFLREHGVEFVGATYIESTLLRGRQLLKNFGLPEDEVMNLIDELKIDLFEEEYLSFKQSR